MSVARIVSVLIRGIVATNTVSLPKLGVVGGGQRGSESRQPARRHRHCTASALRGLTPKVVAVRSSISARAP